MNVLAPVHITLLHQVLLQILVVFRIVLDYLLWINLAITIVYQAASQIVITTKMVYNASLSVMVRIT